MANELNLAIEGMHCGACVRRVTAALGALDGVTVEAVEIGSAKVEFNPAQVSTTQIHSAIDRIGFKVSAGNAAGE